MMNDIRSTLDRGYAYGKSLIHYKTMKRTTFAFFSGFFILIGKSITYVGAQEMKELKEKNPTAWNDERSRRRWFIGYLLCGDVFTLVFLLVLLPKYGPLFWMLAHTILFIWVGRQEPILNKVQTKRMIGEELLRTITDEMTLTKAARKEGATSYITTPPHSLERTKGYRFTVRVHQQGNPVFMLTNLPTLCHKLQKGNGQVFTYQDEEDNSLITGVVLRENPFKRPATQNPLVLHPRRFNVWKEAVHLGYMPDLSDWVRHLITEGDGGGILVGGAPRKGKSVFIRNILVYLMLDPVCNIHLIDGKSLDFPDIKPVAKTYIGEDDMEDLELLRESTALLERMKQEILRRKTLFKQHDADNVTEELCKRLSLQLEWIVIDELAVITEDLMSTHKREVIHFISLLQYCVRMGPAFGVLFLLATQRPSDKSVPDAIRSLIIWRIAFYISSQPGSMAILGKAGPEYRADWLPHDPILYKGVALSIGDGRVRGHKITKNEFRSICHIAQALRAVETQHEDVVYEYPEPVNSMIAIMESYNRTRMYTFELLPELAARGLKFITGTELATKVRPYGVTPRNVKVDGKDAKGYVLENLREAPKVVSTAVAPPVSEPLPAVAETAGDGTKVWLATADQEDDDAG